VVHADSLSQESSIFREGSKLAETPNWLEDAHAGTYNHTSNHLYSSKNPENKIERLQVDFAGIGEHFDGFYAMDTEWQL